MMTTGTQETHEFQAEVKQVLDIVVHSLYTDKEIFLRELISNASDALEKLRHTQLSEKDIFDDHLPLEIKITSDEDAKTITIQDFGIGMTREELIENLGTIAHSGSKAFLEALKASGGNNESLIGQFGVGFYSAFMVAEKVDVFTRSWRADASCHHWASDGSGQYTLEDIDGERRGCKIVIHLKDDFKEFAQKTRIEAIIQRYSNFVSFPIYLNEERVNTLEALWTKPKSELKEEDLKAFYQFQAHAFDEPFTWMHFTTDAPLDIHTLLFVPGENTEQLGISRYEAGVSLYCRKVLIDPSPKQLLPEWLRFLKGVVDSADLPLNISRESMQDSALIAKLKTILTRRFLKMLESMASDEAERYTTFWEKFGNFIKEGTITDFGHREQLSKLLRFESSAQDASTLTGLQAYVSRMPEGQKDIYFLHAANRSSAEQSPYLEAFKARKREVLFIYEPIDDFALSHLATFEGKQLISADKDGIDMGSPETADENPLDPAASAALCTWIQELLGEDKTSQVTASNRLTETPMIALNSDSMMTGNMRKILERVQGDLPKEPALKLEVNPNHPLIKQLSSLQTSNPDRGKLIVEQLYDNARMAAGLLENPNAMVKRINTLLEALAHE